MQTINPTSGEAFFEKQLNCLQYLTTTDLSQGGVVRSVLDLSEQLALAGHHVSFVTHESPNSPNQWLKKEEGKPHLVQLGPLTKLTKRMHAKDTSTFRELVDNVDIIHLHVPWAPSNLQAAQIARSAGIPYAITLHGMLDDWSMKQRSMKKRIYLRLAAKRLLEEAAFVHCTASEELRQSQVWFPKGQGRVLPLTIAVTDPPGDLSMAREAFPIIDPANFNLLFVGRLHPVKGIEHLVNAVARLVKMGHPVQSLLIGTGEPKYVEKLKVQIAQLELSDRVHFIGHVSGSLKWSLYKAADLLVLPSLHENFGLVSVESLLCGTPCVVSKNVHIWEKLSQAGAILSKNDGIALASAIAPLIRERHSLPKRGKSGRQFVLDWLNPSKLMAELTNLYCEATSAT